MSAPVELHGGELAEELLFLGAALAHVALYYERKRLERIERRRAMLAANVRAVGRAVRNFA